MVLFLTAGKILPSHDLCPETFQESLDHGQGRNDGTAESNGRELPLMQAVQWIIIIVEGWNVEFF